MVKDFTGVGAYESGLQPGVTTSWEGSEMNRITAHSSPGCRISVGSGFLHLSVEVGADM